VSSSYELTPRLTAIGGIDFVSTDFNDGTNLNNPTDKDSGKSEEVINVSLGLRATINPALSGECILNYTDSTSDFSSATFTRDFDRMRLSVGVNYTF
jgi:long-subunit fatty acid transport protein